MEQIVLLPTKSQISGDTWVLNGKEFKRGTKNHGLFVEWNQPWNLSKNDILKILNRVIKKT